MKSEVKPPESRHTPTSILAPPLPPGLEHLRSAIRFTATVSLLVLIVSNAVFFFGYQSLRTRIETQQHTVLRLNNRVSALLMSTKNNDKIEEIEKEVSAIYRQMEDLARTIQERPKNAH